MLSTLRLLLVLIAAFTALPVLAIPVEAEGRAAIINGDLHSARKSAIQDAAQAASMQAGAYISTTQEISDGVLSLDNMAIRSLGEVRNIEVIDEWREGQMFHVRIRADVAVDDSCNGNPGLADLRKSVALTLFPLQTPTEANTGALGEIQWQLPALIAQSLNGAAGIEPYNLSRHNLVTRPDSAPTHLLPEGALSNALSGSTQLKAQFIVSGVIRDMSMRMPVGPREPNILADWYNRADYASKRHLRRLVLDLFIYDGFSGELLEQRRYETAGRWTRPHEERTGFGTSVFWQQDYGQKVQALIETIRQDLRDSLSCKPFMARITRTRADEVWIDAGSLQGLKEGDRLTIYRRLTHYDEQMRAYSELIDTRVELRLERVQQDMARGRIQGDSQSHNIQRDDLVIARQTR
jgi:hypothetical protein